MGSHDLWARNQKIVFHGISNPRAWASEIQAAVCKSQAHSQNKKMFSATSRAISCSSQINFDSNVPECYIALYNC